MDQSAFRDLLASAPKSRPPTGRQAGLLGGKVLKRGQGSSHGKHQDFKVKEKSETEGLGKPAFAPRKVKKDGKYKDRAEMRRLDAEDEFKPIERMVNEFEERAKAEGQHEDAVAEKRAYLGGDAEHSALFKGLDFGLLEARKAELAVQEGQKFDDELDAVLEKSEPDQSTSEAGPGPSTTGQAAQKRSREDIMNALKESRKRLTGAGQDEQRESKRVKVEQPAPGLGGRFKSIAKAKAETEAAEEAAKLKKKKKKKVKTVTVTAPESVEAVPEAISFVQKPLKTETPTIQSIAMTATKEKSVEQKTETPVVPAEPDLAPEPVAMPAARLPIPPLPLVEKLPVPGSESEDDIFGGVGDYELGIGSDSSSEEDDEDKPKKPLKRERVPEMNPLTAKKGKGWFGDDEEEDLSTRSMLPDILRATRPAESSAVGSQRGLSRSPSPGDGTLRRLQPLSSSRLPSAKELLELDAAATADEKKRERKAKWRAKQGLPSQGGQEDDDEDTRRSEKDREGDEKRKLNRETQQLQNYMAKQKS